jgi:hypothetical protein
MQNVHTKFRENSHRVQMFMLGIYMQHGDLSLMVPSTKIESKITKHVYGSIDTTEKTGTRQDTERKRTYRCISIKRGSK